MTTDNEEACRKAAALYVEDHAKVIGLPLPDLPSLHPLSAEERADIQAQSARLAQEHQGLLAMMDRYLDSRDAADDDTSNEWVMTTDPQSNGYIRLAVAGSGAQGEDDDR